MRVLVVDDSSFTRLILRDALEASGDIQVIAEADSGEAAINQVERMRPDLVTLDIQMPGLGGLATIERIMATHPLPIVVITSQPLRNERSLAFEATRRGALEVLEKGAVAGSSQEQELFRIRSASSLELM